MVRTVFRSSRFSAAGSQAHRVDIAVVWVLALSVLACGQGGGPGSPSAARLALGGKVLEAATRVGIADALVEIVEGPNAGRSTRTSADGSFRLDDMERGSFTVRASHPEAQPQSTPTALTAGDAQISLVLRPRPCETPGCGGPNGCNRILAFLGRPFDGGFRVANHFDHAYPQSFGDGNASIQNYCGVARSYNGHEGYDWVMPVGTPLRALSPGTVTFAGTGGTFFCPLVGRNVANTIVEIEHAAPTGERFRVRYLHVSSMAVQQGQPVSGGDIVAASGNEGCSTGPHLHLDVRRQFGTSTEFAFTDPYGWQGPGEDPWSAHDRGAFSAWLWSDPPSIAGAHAGPAILEYHPPEQW